MHKSALAPVLSATRSRDSCWIIELLRLLEDLHDAPALGRRQRPGLHEEHPVADTGGVGLVVRLDLGRTPDGLAVTRVLHPVLDLDRHRLRHLVADDVALTCLAEATRRARPSSSCLSHLFLRPRSYWRPARWSARARVRASP